MSQIRIEPGRLLEIANDLEEKRALYDSQIKLLEETEASISSMWESPVKDEFRRNFQAKKDVLWDYSRELQQYVNAMRKAAENYIRTERQNEELIRNTNR